MAGDGPGNSPQQDGSKLRIVLILNWNGTFGTVTSLGRSAAVQPARFVMGSTAMTSVAVLKRDERVRAMIIHYLKDSAAAAAGHPPEQKRLEEAAQTLSRVWKVGAPQLAKESHRMDECMPAQADVVFDGLIEWSFAQEALVRKMPQEALAHVSKAISVLRFSPEFYTMRAQILSQFGDFEPALVDARRAVRLDPSYVPGVVQLGYILWITGKTKAGIEALEAGLSRSPRDAALLHNLRVLRSGRPAPQVPRRRVPVRRELWPMLDIVLAHHSPDPDPEPRGDHDMVTMELMHSFMQMIAEHSKDREVARMLEGLGNDDLHLEVRWEE